MKVEKIAIKEMMAKKNTTTKEIAKRKMIKAMKKKMLMKMI